MSVFLWNIIFNFIQGLKNYGLSTNTKTWFDAQNDCLKRNGSLVSIHSKWENSYIKTIIGTNDDRWFGLRRSNNGSYFTYADNTTYGFNYWRKRPGKSNCVRLIGDAKFKWETTHCEDRHKDICDLPGKLLNLLSLLLRIK